MITEVISISKLKSRLKSKAAIIKFQQSFDLILADDRVISSLPVVLGPSFYKSGHNMPVAIKLFYPLPSTSSRIDKSVAAKQVDARFVRHQIKSITKSGRLALTPGTCLSLRVGHSELTAQQLVENIQKMADWLDSSNVKNLDWNNVKSIHIKTPESASLPIFERSR